MHSSYTVICFLNDVTNNQLRQIHFFIINSSHYVTFSYYFLKVLIILYILGIPGILDQRATATSKSLVIFDLRIMFQLKMRYLYSLLLFTIILFQENAFQFYISKVSNPSRRKYNSINMMFNFGGSKKESSSGGKIVITVDGKTIESSEKSVNLRKELMKNNVDVYPLRAKITGNCGGAGICGTCAVKVYIITLRIIYFTNLYKS